jgi:hypothetical protein
MEGIIGPDKKAIIIASIVVGPDRGRRIQNIVGGICSKVLSYEFPGINESISCHYDNDERIKAITRKLLLSTISEKTPNPTVGTKRSFDC